jgi:hypothetical protein
MQKAYRRACHCGRVTFEVRAHLGYDIDCNCSLCRRQGALWHGAAEADLGILTGQEDVVRYPFHTMTAEHDFCGHCGPRPLIRPRLDPTRWDPTRWAVNVRCLDDVDLSSLSVRAFDGEHWEEAAAAFRARGT